MLLIVYHLETSPAWSQHIVPLFFQYLYWIEVGEVGEKIKMRYYVISLDIDFGRVFEEFLKITTFKF